MADEFDLQLIQLVCEPSPFRCLETVTLLTRDREFESGFLQRRVKCEPGPLAHSIIVGGVIRQ